MSRKREGREKARKLAARHVQPAGVNSPEEQSAKVLREAVAREMVWIRRDEWEDRYPPNGRLG